MIAFRVNQKKRCGQNRQVIIGGVFVRLIPFKDHINIEANAISEYKDVLSGYKVTPKGMLQIFLKQELPIDVLKQIFAKTLG